MFATIQIVRLISVIYKFLIDGFTPTFYLEYRVFWVLSDSSQWRNVDTKSNTADVGTRGTSASQMGDSIWLKEPSSETQYRLPR